jgi:hypothetical protein
MLSILDGCHCRVLIHHGADKGTIDRLEMRHGTLPDAVVGQISRYLQAPSRASPSAGPVSTQAVVVGLDSRTLYNSSQLFTTSCLYTPNQSYIRLITMGQEQSKPQPRCYNTQYRAPRRRAESLDTEMKDSIIVEKSGHTYDGIIPPHQAMGQS